MNLKHLSHSSLTAMDECPKKFQLTRLSNPQDRLPSLPADARDIGILAHAYIEAFFRGEDYLQKLVEQNHTEHHAEAWKIFEGWKRKFSVPEESWLFTEREGSVNVDGVPVPIIGYDDFVYVEDGYHVIRDFKTGWGTEVYESYEFQLHLAMLRYEAEYPGVKLKGEIEFVRRGIVSRLQEKVGYDGTKDLVWNDALRSATIQRIKALWNKIVLTEKTYNAFVDQEWPATPGSHCTFCDYKTECAVGKRAAAAHLVVTDEASALATLREIVLMDEAIKAMKEALRPYCDANGRIESGDGKYDYYADFIAGGESQTIDDVPEVLKIVGTELPKGVLKIDTKLKGAQALLADERIKPYLKTKTSKPAFKVGKKIGKDEEDDG